VCCVGSGVGFLGLSSGGGVGVVGVDLWVALGVGVGQWGRGMVLWGGCGWGLEGVGGRWRWVVGG